MKTINAALSYPSEKNVSQYGHVAVGTWVKCTPAWLAKLQAHGIGRDLVEALSIGGEVMQIVVGPCWVSVIVRLSAPPANGAYPDTSESPDNLELINLSTHPLTPV